MSYQTPIHFRFFHRLRAFVLCAAMCPAAPVDWTGRYVPARVGAGVMSDKAAADAIVLPFSLTADDARRDYGLFVPGATVARVEVNGRPLDMRPVKRRDGLMLRISPMYLRPGNNQADIERAGAAAGVTWEGTTLFALDGTAEEAHFSRVFSDAPAGIQAQPDPDPLQALYDVQWYDCAWSPGMTDSVLNAATVWMGAHSLNSTLQTVALDFDSNSGNLIVDSVDSGPGTSALPWSISGLRLYITLPAPVPAGNEFRVRVVYHGRPSTSSAFSPPYLLDYHGSPSKAVLFTFSEPSGARQWWPCKDLPDDKAATTTQRITIPSGAGWRVVSNGALAAITNNGATETWTWNNHFPIATYLLSMCITNYTAVSAVYTSRDGKTTMPISHHIFPENIGVEGNAAAGTLQVMNFFADTFGEYPFLTEKYWTASHTDGAGMEHQTCTSMPGGDVQDGLQRRNIHELAHQWYGDMITCRNFDHLWLNEGFGTYAEALWVEHISGLAAYHTCVNEWLTQGVSTSVPLVGPNSDSFNGSVVYRKGAWVLHMLRHVIGDANMFTLLRVWAADSHYAYGTALSLDFETVAEAVSGQDLSSFFSQWLYRPGGSETSGRPRYYYTGSAAPGGESSGMLSLRITQSQSGSPFVMPVDIQMTNAAGTRMTTTVLNSMASQSYSLNTGAFVPVELSFDPDTWIFKSMSLSVNTCGLPPARRDTAYSRTLKASNGSTPYTWSITSGQPPGLTLSGSGALSGTPTAEGDYSIGITARDKAGTSRSVTLRLTVLPSVSGIEDWQNQ